MPLHPPPASGSGSSLAKEHVAKEHVCGGVAERSSAACARSSSSNSMVGPLATRDAGPNLEAGGGLRLRAVACGLDRLRTQRGARARLFGGCVAVMRVE